MTDESKAPDILEHDIQQPRSFERPETTEFKITLYPQEKRVNGVAVFSANKGSQGFENELRELFDDSDLNAFCTRHVEKDKRIVYSFAGNELTAKQKAAILEFSHKYDVRKQKVTEDFTCLFPQNSQGRLQFEADLLALCQPAATIQLNNVRDISWLEVIPVAADNGLSEPQMLYHFKIALDKLTAQHSSPEEIDNIYRLYFSKISDLAKNYGGKFFKGGRDMAEDPNPHPRFLVMKGTRALVQPAKQLSRRMVSECFTITIQGGENIVGFEDAIAKSLFPESPISPPELHELLNVSHQGSAAIYTFKARAEVAHDSTRAIAQKMLHEQETTKILDIAGKYDGIYTSLSPIQSLH